MRLDLSVIICAYTEERWDELAAAVTSVQSQLISPREIILVIDHNPALLERVRSHFHGLTILENHESPGLAGARNSGIAAAQGAIIAFLDDDAVATPDWLEQLAIGYQDPQVIGIGGKIEPLWPQGRAPEGRPSWFPEEFDWVVGCTYRGMPEQSVAVRNLIGANMSFRREVFTAVGFYKGIGHIGGRPFGGSDPDFCIRVTQQWPERTLLYQPQARVFHQVSSKRATWRYFRLRCYNEGLSKSLLTRRVGTRQGLSSERAYTWRTLPRGIFRGVADSLAQRDSNGFARAGAIVGGLGFTTAGYLAGTAAQYWSDLKQAIGVRRSFSQDPAL